ncbi:MAG: right-handed parallel beta-helix repeat-containing protein, partial [Verrucomicrobiota bacterium]|nr:right-handed parallel beta-helix repeat-containing protein [Verrucomicrobiota bacterium]
MFNKFFIWLCLIPFIALDGAKILRVKKSNQSTSVDPSELGSSWSKAFTNLQDALATAQAGDEIWVSEGTYLPTEGTTFESGYEREQSFSLVDGVSLYGGFKGNERNRLLREGDTNQTILSGEIHDNPTYWSLHVITGHELTSDIIIDGFRIEKGNANGVLNQLTDANQTVNVWGVGAGIFLWESSGDLKIDNCVFTQNYSMPEHGNGDGSCIYLNAKTFSNFDVKISNTKFIENYSDGSLFQLNGSTTYEQLSFTNVDFLNNNGHCVNVLGNSISQLSFANVDFLNNNGQDIGVVGQVSNADFSQCTFIGNQGTETLISMTSLQKGTFEYCTFEKNKAEQTITIPSNADDTLHEVILDNVQFSENNGTSLDAPENTQVLVSDSQFEGNNGSAIKAVYQVAVTNSIFQDLNDSAISMDGSPGFVEVRDSSFINNHSSNNGGAIFCKTINVANIIFRENYAK